MSTQLKERAKELINEYSLETFENAADFEDTERVPLAHSENEYGELVQVYADIDNLALIFEVGSEVHIDTYKDYEDFIDNELIELDFDELVSRY